jgi:hypothetical protein
MTFRRSRFTAADSPPPFRRQPFRRWASSPRPFRRGCSTADLFLATCYSYFSINLTKRRIFSFSCQCHLFINGLIASQGVNLSDT